MKDENESLIQLNELNISTIIFALKRKLNYISISTKDNEL